MSVLYTRRACELSGLDLRRETAGVLPCRIERDDASIRSIGDHRKLKPNSKFHNGVLVPANDSE